MTDKITATLYNEVKKAIVFGLQKDITKTDITIAEYYEARIVAMIKDIHNCKSMNDLQILKSIYKKNRKEEK